MSPGQNSASASHRFPDPPHCVSGMKPGVGSGLRFGALAPNHLAIIHPFFEVRTPFVALAYRLGPYSRVYDFTYISPNMYLSSNTAAWDGYMAL